jgi:hypothetical protein
MTEEDQIRERARSKGGNLPPGVYWRHRTLWISYYVTGSDGRRAKYRECTEATSPREAAALRATRITDHGRGERTIESGKVTVGDALAAVRIEYEQKDRASLDTAFGKDPEKLGGRAKAIADALGVDTLAIEVTNRIDAAMLRWKRAGLSHTTINHYRNLLTRGLRLLVRKRKLAFVPYLPRLDERSEPARYITQAEAEKDRQRKPPMLPDPSAYHRRAAACRLW